MATSCATYIYNHIANDEDILTSDIFTGTKFLFHELKEIHVRGFPIYFLYTTLQQGHKLPKWQPQYFHGMFFGFSQNHSIDVPRILNPDTVHISP